MLMLCFIFGLMLQYYVCFYDVNKKIIIFYNVNRFQIIMRISGNVENIIISVVRMYVCKICCQNE